MVWIEHGWSFSQPDGVIPFEVLSYPFIYFLFLFLYHVILDTDRCSIFDRNEDLAVIWTWRHGSFSTDNPFRLFEFQMILLPVTQHKVFHVPLFFSIDLACKYSTVRIFLYQNVKDARLFFKKINTKESAQSVRWHRLCTNGVVVGLFKGSSAPRLYRLTCRWAQLDT